MRTRRAPPSWTVLLVAALASLGCGEPKEKEPAPGSMADIMARYETKEGRGAGKATASGSEGTDPSSAGAPDPSLPGRDEYEEAKAAVLAGATRRAMELLSICTDRLPSCPEYWYQLGAAESNLAIETVNESETEAVALYRDAVRHKRTALQLIDRDGCTFWTPPACDQARHDAMMALDGVETFIDNDAVIVEGLRMYASQR